MPYVDINEAGQIIGRYESQQREGQTFIESDHPDVVAFLTSPPEPDQSNLDNIAKRDKAILLAAATMAGRTPTQARAAFKAAWDALP